MADAPASHDGVRRASYIASLTQLAVPPYASGHLRIRIDTESVTRTASSELEEGDRRAVALTFAFLDQLVRDGVESDRKQGRYLQGAVELIRVTLERIGPGDPAVAAWEDIMRRAVDAYVGWRVGLDIVGPMRALEQVLPAPLVEQRLAEERERLARWTADHAAPPPRGVWHARQRPESPSDG